MRTAAPVFAISLLLVASTRSLVAADLVTVRIPIRLTSLDPSVSAIRVACRLTGADPATGRSRTFGRTKTSELQVTERSGRRLVDESTQIVFTDSDLPSAELAHLDKLTGGTCGLSFRVDGVWVEMNEAGGPGLALTPKLNTPFRARAPFSF